MLRIYQSSFAGGEISPALKGQTQFSKYSVAAEKLLNIIPEPFGGAANRPGMYFLGNTLNNSPARLIKFEYSAATQYLLEFGDYYLRIWSEGAPIKDNYGYDVTVISPYSLSQVWDLKFTQSADYMFICCPGVAPHKLIRYSEILWDFEEFSARLGPFKAWNTTETKVKANIAADVATLTSSAPLFDQLHAGQFIKLRHYVPRKSIGDNVIPLPPIPPAPITLPVGQWIFGEDGGLGEEYDSNVSIEISGYWSGAISVHVFDPNNLGNPNRDVTFTVTNSLQESVLGKPKNMSRFIEWFDDVSKRARIEVKVSSAVTINGIQDNQLKISLQTAGNYLTYPYPPEPMIKTDNPKIIGSELIPAVLIPWTTVKGSWTFITSGLWSGNLYLDRSTDGGVSFVTVAEKGSSYNSNANFAGAEIDDGVLYRLRGNITVEKDGLHSCDYRFSFGDIVETGVAKISAIHSATFATAKVEQQFGANEFTADWAVGSWYSGNYPQVCTMYQNRLIFANTNEEPQTVWASKIGDYENFGTSTPLADDDAINVTLSGVSVNQIRSLVPAADLMILTNSTEFKLRGDIALSPLSVSVERPQSFRGSSLVDPVIIGNSVLFVSKNGKTVRDFAYMLNSDGYDGQDRSILAPHIFEDTEIIAMAYQQEPWSVLWFLGADGSFASMTYIKEHDVWAWAQHLTDGHIIDICAVYNYVFIVVKRGEDYFIEFFGERNDIFLDSALEYIGSEPVNSVTGLDHLAGKKVSIVADGFVLNDQIAAPDGSVNLAAGAATQDDLNKKYSRIIIGLPYTALVKTLPVAVELDKGATVGVNKKITAVTSVVNNTRSFKAGVSINDYDLVECRKRDALILPDSPDKPESGKFFTNIKCPWNDDGAVFLIQKLPLPFELLGVELCVEIAG